MTDKLNWLLVQCLPAKPFSLACLMQPFLRCRYVGQEQFLGKVVIEYGAYFLASYFAIGVIFDTFTLGVLAASAVQYSTNTEAFMAAVKEVAGASKRGPSINLVEKAQTAVNAVKVASALNQISSLLKVRQHEEST